MEVGGGVGSGGHFWEVLGGKAVSWAFVCLLGTIVICEVKVRVYNRGGRSLEYKYIKKPRTLYSKLESE